MAEPPIQQQHPQQSFLSGKMDANSIDNGSEDVRMDNSRDDMQQLQHRGLQKLKTTDGHQRKKGSFQITKVVTKSGVNDDLDMLDDPDETNTEDLSSELVDVSKTTDIEPDMSSTEDTVTSLDQGQEEAPRDTVKSYQQFEQIPSTQSQIVPPVMPVTNNQILQTQMSQEQETSGKVNDIQSRFRVVKIESSEPFKRGRWTCLDFLDPPSSEKGADKSEKPIDEIGSGNSSASSSIHYVHGVDDPSKNPLLANLVVHAEGHPILEPQPVHPLQNGGGQNPLLASQQPGPESSSSHGLQGNISTTQTSQQSQASASSQASHIQNVIAPQGSVSTPHLDLNTQTYAQSTAGMPPSGTTNGHVASQSQAQAVHNQVTLHTTLSQQSHNTPAHHTDQTEAFGLMPPTSELSSQPQQNLNQPTGENLAGQGQSSALSQSITPAPQEFVQQATVSHPVVSTTTSNTTSPSNENMQGSDFITQEHGYAGASEEKSHSAETQRTISEATSSMLKQISAAHTILSPPLLEYVSATLQQVPTHHKDDDESNASTVAIDNKIEQAMDLVKSHLMFAVREEVEILKENIKELTEKNNLLMEKNTQLERENSILRSAAAPETLAQIASSSASTQPPPTSSS